MSINAGDLGLIPELGKCPGVGNGNSLQYSCLKILWQRSLTGYSPWGHKEVDLTEHAHSRGSLCVQGGWSLLSGSSFCWGYRQAGGCLQDGEWCEKERMGCLGASKDGHSFPPSSPTPPEPDYCVIQLIAQWSLFWVKSTSATPSLAMLSPAYLKHRRPWGLHPELGCWSPSPCRSWDWPVCIGVDCLLPFQFKQKNRSARQTQGQSCASFSPCKAAGGCLSQRNRFAQWNVYLVSLADPGNTPATLPLPANQAVS